MSGSGLDRNDDFQKFCGSGLDRIRFYQIRTGLGLKSFTVRSSLVETSEPFTITPAALNGRIISSADYHWLKQGPVNQSRGHLSASRSGPKGIVINFLKSFRWARKCLLQTEVYVARKKSLFVLWCSCGQY